LRVAGAPSLAAGPPLTDAGSANTKSAGVSLPDKLSPQLREITVAQGSTALENPSAVTGSYGYFADGPMLPAPGDMQSATHDVEATKSEPDKNTYLVVKGQHGADPKYRYGTHFLYQGHELSDAQDRSYITRINLDADAAHRVTKLAETESDGSPVPEIDGSTWDPFAHKLLFTTEGGDSGGVVQATLDYPSTVTKLWGILGQGGYEGIQNDRYGNVYVVEDASGAAGTVNTHAKQPNSFLFRFLPKDVHDLKQGGRLQVLQVASLAHAGPIVFHAGQADADILSQDVADLHTYGKTFETTWLTIHDTATDGTAPFDANALAKTSGGTPFKRPENGQFAPGSKFRTFFFDETGDTNLKTEAGAGHGGFGSIMKLQQNPRSNSGTLRLFYASDAAHSSLDNVTFYDAKHVIFVQDMGDGLHTDLNALNSAYLFDTHADYSHGAQPVRIIAEGRDPSATIDSALSALGNGFQNEGDNEITGVHMSNGDPTAKGLLGARKPTPFRHGWRLFFTHQHGDNVTSELVRASGR
jgi:Alkaline phosphatase PhoX